MTDENPIARCAYFIIRAKPAKFPGDARFGLVATKKTFRFAVQRNLAKRKLRDWIRFAGDDALNPAADYVFIARRAILDAARDDGRDAMVRALRFMKHEYERSIKK